MVSLPLALLNWFSAVLMVLVGVYCLRFRLVPASRAISLGMFLFAFWALCDGISFASPDLPSKVFWLRIRFPAIDFIPVVWIIVALIISGQQHRISTQLVALLSIIPLASLILGWTSDFHNLFRFNPHLDNAAEFPIVNFTSGPWFYVHTFYSYLLVVMAMIMLLISMRGTYRIYRQQIGLILLAMLIPSIGNLLFILDLPSLHGYDPTPIFLISTGFLFGMALFRFQLLDITPIARGLIVDNLKDLFFVVDTQLRVVDLNPAVINLLQLDPGKAIAQPLEVVFKPWVEFVERYRSVESAEDEIVIPADSGPLTFNIMISPIKDNHKQLLGRLIMLHDITQRKQMEEALRQANSEMHRHLKEIEMLEEQLREQAIADPITGLFNHRYLEETLERELTRAIRNHTPLGLLYIDIDHFSDIKKNFGHEACDQVLHELGEQLQLHTRGEDLACRHGEDEFILLMPEAAMEASIQRAEEIRQNIQNLTIHSNGRTLGITLAIGVAAFPHSAQTGSDLIRVAQEAVAEGRETGRNFVKSYEPAENSGKSSV